MPAVLPGLTKAAVSAVVIIAGRSRRKTLLAGKTGVNSGSVITGSYNTATVTGTAADSKGFSQVGGISGSNKGTVNGESYNTGDVEAGG